MMIFAAYYGFHYWLQFGETCSGLNLSCWLGSRYRWPQPQASEDAPMGAWTWPIKPDPPETSHKGCVCGPRPKFILLDFAAIL
jgi:hypothetical protein